jgi:hypothetical protein
METMRGMPSPPPPPPSARALPGASSPSPEEVEEAVGEAASLWALLWPPPAVSASMAETGLRHRRREGWQEGGRGVSQLCLVHTR